MKKVIICLLCSFMLFAAGCEKDNDDIVQNINPAGLLPEDFKIFHNIFDGAGIGAGVWLHDDVVVVFDKTGYEYAWIENGVVMDKRNIEDAQSLFKIDGDNQVTAAVVLKTTLYLIGANGSDYRSVSIEDITQVKGKWNQVDFFTPRTTIYPLSYWGIDNSCPFQNITAALGIHPLKECGSADKGSLLVFFDKLNKEFSAYESSLSNFNDVLTNVRYPMINCANEGRSSLNLAAFFDATFIYPVGGTLYEVFFYNQGREFVYSKIGSLQVSESYRLVP